MYDVQYFEKHVVSKSL